MNKDDLIAIPEETTKFGEIHSTDSPEFIILNTPSGRLAIDKNKIYAVVEPPSFVRDDATGIKSHVYIGRKKEPFRILDSFDEVMNKLVDGN